MPVRIVFFVRLNECMPGYRVHFARRGRTVYLLLSGGDKSSRTKDIRTAKELLAEFEDWWASSAD